MLWSYMLLEKEHPFVLPSSNTTDPLLPLDKKKNNISVKKKLYYTKKPLIKNRNVNFLAKSESSFSTDDSSFLHLFLKPYFFLS